MPEARDPGGETAGEPSVRAARAAYFAANGFAPDGGYTDRWVTLQAGPLRFAFPNTPARVRAVRYHDVHHVLTGYATSWTGEAEIAAWELASGCAGFVAAWVLNAYALTVGLFVAPRAVWRAFLRGRHSRNLYRATFDEALLDGPLGALRRTLALEAEGPPAATLADRALFALAAAAGLTLGLATTGLALLPVALLLGADG